MGIGVMMMTTGGVTVGTRSASSLHQRAMVKMTVTYVASSTAEMHMAGSKDGAEIGSVMSRNNATRGTMITMALTMTSLTGSIVLKDDTFQEASRPILET
jgi:hypothetical protein